MSVAFRPVATANSPQYRGLGIGDEWRWAVGAFLPLADSKFRVGLTLFGQTGLSNGAATGNTIFTAHNTPIEWQGEGRMRFGPYNRFWAGAGAGSRIADGYGAPDLRVVALVGM